MLLTTVEQIWADRSKFLQRIPFVQVVVDRADKAPLQQATQSIPCKRIVCITGNPIPTGFQDLRKLLAVVDPVTLERKKELADLFTEVTSFYQLRKLHDITSRFVVRSHSDDFKPIFQQLRFVDVLVPLTPAQRCYYNMVYQSNSDLLTQLAGQSLLTQAQVRRIELVEDLLRRCCTSLFLVDLSEKPIEGCLGSLRQKKEQKYSSRQALVSGKVSAMQSVLETLEGDNKRVIVCTRYPGLIVQLKKYLKDTGIACFTYEPLKTIDTVQRFNYFSKPAVFLHLVGQTWTKSKSSFFDLTCIQNILLFEGADSSEDALIKLFQVCQLPFSSDIKVINLVAQDTLEHVMFQKNLCTKRILKSLFSKKNIFKGHDEDVKSSPFAFPFAISTHKDGKAAPLAKLPPSEIDIIMRQSIGEINATSAMRLADTAVVETEDVVCFVEKLKEALLVHEEMPSLDEMKAAALRMTATDKHNKFERLRRSVLAYVELEKSHKVGQSSEDFYMAIFGMEFGTSVDREKAYCGHDACQ